MGCRTLSALAPQETSEAAATAAVWWWWWEGSRISYPPPPLARSYQDRQISSDRTDLLLQGGILAPVFYFKLPQKKKEKKLFSLPTVPNVTFSRNQHLLLVFFLGTHSFLHSFSHWPCTGKKGFSFSPGGRGGPEGFSFLSSEQLRNGPRTCSAVPVCRSTWGKYGMLHTA